MTWKIAKKEFLLNLLTFQFAVGMYVLTCGKRELWKCLLEERREL